MEEVTGVKEMSKTTGQKRRASNEGDAPESQMPKLLDEITTASPVIAVRSVQSYSSCPELEKCISSSAEEATDEAITIKQITTASPVIDVRSVQSYSSCPELEKCISSSADEATDEAITIKQITTASPVIAVRSVQSYSSCPELEKCISSSADEATDEAITIKQITTASPVIAVRSVQSYSSCPELEKCISSSADEATDEAITIKQITTTSPVIAVRSVQSYSSCPELEKCISSSADEATDEAITIKQITTASPVIAVRGVQSYSSCPELEKCISSSADEATDEAITIKQKIGSKKEGANPNIKCNIPGKNRKQQYEKKVPKFFIGAEPKVGLNYIYIIEVTETNNVSASFNNNSPEIGFLMSKMLPEVNPYTICTRNGKMIVKVRLSNQTVTLNDVKIKEIEEFHKSLFRSLNMDKNKVFHPPSSRMPLYIVPLSKDDISYHIDWSFLTAITHQDERKNDFLKKLQNIGIILHKFNVLLLAEDLRQLISLTELTESSAPDTTEIINFLNNANETVQPPSNFCFRDIKKDKDKIISFTENMDLKGPNLGLLLEAILLKKCDKNLNLERLELIGDSLLKLVITIKILNEFPDERKEILSTKRSNIIDNFNLYIRAIEKNIPPYIITDEYQKGNFIPPSYIMKEDFQQFHNKKILSDKDIADVIEAIIGAYLISSGQKAAIRLMNFFNLQPLSDVKNIEITKDFEWPKMVNITGDEDFEIVQETQYQLNKFQNKINHKFNKKTLLYIALSHPHKQEYEKLFYLGEAINDYLITRYIFENNKNIGPGELTNFRDILKSHEYKGFLGLKFEFHLLESEELKEQLHSIKESEQYIFFEEKGHLSEKADSVYVPKSLAKKFDVVSAAIFLDSKLSIDKVWQVIFPMLEPALSYYKENMPINSVSELDQLLKGNFKVNFHMENEVAKVKIILPDGEEITSEGKNKKTAKENAAKKALIAWKNKNISS